MTAYKRPELLFSDLEWLKEVARTQLFQITFTGLAHSNDRGGQGAIRALSVHIYDRVIPAVFRPGHNLELAAALVAAGCNIRLNTPLPPIEASGTSGMRAAVNGTLNLSVPDCGWVEGCVEGVAGWSIDHQPDARTDASALYDKLQNVVLHLYHGDRSGWIRTMKQSTNEIGSSFDYRRMIRRYVTEAYMR